ncbi:DUF4817 domain-containing protein, partial [Trichonephila clavipes]
LFRDEAHFWLNGCVNKQNCRLWSEANPQEVYVETPLHLEKLTVWCALWAGGIIGPYFFKNEEGHNVTVNGDRYRAMITNFFIPELNNHDVQELWFQQDGATCHYSSCHNRFIERHTLQDALFICYKQSPDNAHLNVFSQHSGSPRLIEDETLNDSDIINNLMDYEDEQEEPNSLRADKNMQGSSFPTNWKTNYLFNKHGSDTMGRRLYLPWKFDDLARQLEQIWQEIPHDLYSMPRHVAACIQVRGASTPY